MDGATLSWDGWEPLVRILVVGVLGRAWFVGVLRLSGPRTVLLFCDGRFASAAMHRRRVLGSSVAPCVGRR